MNKLSHSKIKFPRSNILPLCCMLPFLLALACNFNLTNQSSNIKETEIEVSLQSTQLAEKEATLNAQQTEIQNTSAQAPAATLPPADTETPTLPAEPTLPEATQPPATEAPTPTIKPSTLQVTDWNLRGFFVKTSDCRNEESPCWGVETNNSSYIISTNKIYIDPAWKRPYLVFYHEYNLPDKISDWGYSSLSEGLVYIQSDGHWSSRIAFNGASNGWREEKVNLEDFSGKEILIKFATETEVYRLGLKLFWYIQDVRIVPDFKS